MGRISLQHELIEHLCIRDNSSSQNSTDSLMLNSLAQASCVRADEVQKQSTNYDIKCSESGGNAQSSYKGWLAEAVS